MDSKNIQDINQNLYKFEKIISEYTRMITEENLKIIKSFNPNWNPDLSNKINRIIYIFNRGEVQAVYELNFIINLSILKRLLYKNRDTKIDDNHLEYISKYLIKSLKTNFQNPEIINLSGFKLFYYTKNHMLNQTNTKLYMTNVKFDLLKTPLIEPLDAYMKTFVFSNDFQEIQDYNMLTKPVMVYNYNELPVKYPSYSIWNSKVIFENENKKK
jgi:hypothetical protein